jgi:hypothetical protein
VANVALHSLEIFHAEQIIKTTHHVAPRTTVPRSNSAISDRSKPPCDNFLNWLQCRVNLEIKLASHPLGRKVSDWLVGVATYAPKLRKTLRRSRD